MPLQPKGLSVGFEDLYDQYALAQIDAINPTLAPWEMLFGGIYISRGSQLIVGTALTTKGGQIFVKNAKIFKGRVASQFTAKFRNTDWVDNTPISQIQHSFRRAKEFGVKGNQNKRNLDKFKESIKKHILDKDTIIIKRKLHDKPMTDYYNIKNKLIVMRGKDNQFHAGWKINPKQEIYLFKNGKIGGN